MIITFAGHAFIPGIEKVKNEIKEQIRKNVQKNEPLVCYLGGYGSFDEISAHACKELKKENYNIEMVYVAPYISIAEQEKIKMMQKQGLCDFSIYPSLENVPKRFAISKRNEWMMTNADFVIAYVERDFGGAYKSLKVAKRKNKKIINICNQLTSKENGREI